jgi:hypothetical protein
VSDSKGEKLRLVARLQIVSTTWDDCGGLEGTPGDNNHSSRCFPTSHLGSEVLRHHKCSEDSPRGFESLSRHQVIS